MKKVIFTLTILFFLCSVQAVVAEIYSWKDKNGRMHFTDSLHNVPPEYRDQVDVKEESGVSTFSTIKDSAMKNMPTYLLPEHVQTTIKWRNRATFLSRRYQNRSARLEHLRNQYRRLQNRYNLTTIDKTKKRTLDTMIKTDQKMLEIELELEQICGDIREFITEARAARQPAKVYRALTKFDCKLR